MSSPLTTPAPRALWADWLRLLAIYLVVLCHCCDPFTFNPNATPTPEMSYWGAVWQCLSRPSVPLFVCLTGYLLLPIRQEMGAFYKKRILRVLWPFLIWSALYNLFPLLAAACGGTASDIQNFFVGSDYQGSTAEVFTAIARIPFNFSPYAVHMWYVYILIGLYLYLPIFSAWVAQASERQKLLVLGFWGFTLFIPYLRELSPQYLGACDWNGFDMLYYFAGFSGYMLLGHMLGRLKPLGLVRALPLSLLLFVLGYALTFVGFRYFQTGGYHEGIALSEGLATALSPAGQGEAYVPIHEICLLYCTPNVALMVAGAILLIRNFNGGSPRLRGLMANLTLCGFGIYMSHYFLVGPVSMLVNSMGTPLALVIPLCALLVLLASWALCALLKKIIPGSWLLG